MLDNFAAMVLIVGPSSALLAYGLSSWLLRRQVPDWVWAAGSSLGYGGLAYTALLLYPAMDTEVMLLTMAVWVLTYLQARDQHAKREQRDPSASLTEP